MEHDRGTRCVSLRLIDVKFVLACRLPACGRRLSRFSGDNLNTVGNNKGGIKTNAKLTDKLAVFLLITTKLLHKRSGSRFRNRAEVIDNIVAGHANTVVADR